MFSLVYLVIMLFGIWLFQEAYFRPKVLKEMEVPYSQFRQDLDAGKISEVTLKGPRIIYSTESDVEADESEAKYNVVTVRDEDLVPELLDAGVTFRADNPSGNILVTILSWLIPLIPLALIGYLLYRMMGRGGAGNILSLGRSKHRVITGEMTGVTFEDVGGVGEVEVELREIIQFLDEPERFTRLGAKLPKGVLMVGPPGTGKTLLARATAGEAGVPFFSINGSGFVELFVGVGAARVRDMFEQAAAVAPCIIFIDEMDAVGQARSAQGTVRTNDEREQTLNQLLAQMDGFEANVGVVIMAATNRPEVLDKALLRPGRFDRQVQVTLPDQVGRKEILEIHARTVPLADDADLNRLAQITPGFSGADLANIVNEAALLAVRRRSDDVTMADFDLAIERVVAGLQRSMPLKGEVRRKVAYHEGGHALVASLLPHTDPVHKVSIIPTAKGALGYTLQMPDEDQYLMGERELSERMAVMLGGRAAELIVFDEPSTGAVNDLAKATDLARRMTTEFGMSEALGPVRYSSDDGVGYLSSQLGLRPELSPQTASLIDQEIRRQVETAQSLALDLLRRHETALHEVAQALQEREVISGEEVERIAEIEP
ncbi:ATP-dependent zinc metalloprotease FtsH [Chloroflexota bacterium]